VSESVKTLKNHYKLLDGDHQKDLLNKLGNLNERLKILDEVNEEFYHNILNRQKIDELSKHFATSKEIEQLIYTTIEKLESSKNSHEESAFIFVKLKEMLEQQNRISESISENEEILDKVNENMSENIGVMKKNLEVIKSRYNKLKEKLKV
jgi:hypothetical protein